MSLFEYTAFNASGQEKTGYFEAQDERTAKLSLFEKGLVLIRLNEVKEISQGKISLVESALLARQLALFLQTGFTLNDAFENAGEGWKKKKIQKKIYFVSYRLKEGRSLEKALEGVRLFPSFFMQILSVAEKSGKLSEAFDSLAIHAEKKSKFQEQWLESLLYPSFLLGASFLVLGCIFQWVFPTLLDLFKQWNRPLPWMTQVILTTGQWFWHQVWILLLLASLAGYFLTRSYRAHPEKWFSLLFRIPFLRNVLKKRQACEFSRNVALLLSGGFHAQECFALAGYGHPFLKQELLKWKSSLEEGHAFNEESMVNIIFPKEFVKMLSLGFKNGKLMETCEKAADFYEKDVNKILNRWTTLIGPLALLLVGTLIGFIVIGMLVPIFDSGI